MTTAGDFHHAWQQLPVSDLTGIIGSGACLILAPHPDDESLGCGGLIASCVAAGRPPLVVVLTDGTGSHPNSASYPARRLRAVREQEARTATGLLGLAADRIVFLREPDTAAPHHGPGLVAVVERLAALVDPHCTAILAPWRHDPHCDHEAASLAAAAAARRTRILHRAYPVWGWTLPAAQRVPASPGNGWRLDITRFLPLKRRAIQAHQSQYGDLIRDDPNGFRLPPDLLSVFDSRYETFIEPQQSDLG